MSLEKNDFEVPNEIRQIPKNLEFETKGNNAVSSINVDQAAHCNLYFSMACSFSVIFLYS